MIQNAKAMVSQHDLIYKTPPRIWEDGFPIGNGHFGAMVWQPEDPGRIVFGITKLDVWDGRFEEQKLASFRRFRELCRTNPEEAARTINGEPKYQATYPCPKPCGRLSIGIDDWILPIPASLFRQSQRLRLHEATVECEYEVSTRAAKVSALIHSSSNVLAIHMENTWAHDRFRYETRQAITLSREIDETLGMPQTGMNGRALYIRYSFPDGFEYVMALIVSGASTTAAISLPDQVRTEVILPQRRTVGPVYTIYLTVVTSKDSSEPMAAALANLEQAESTGFDALRKEHRQWWSGFWECSGVEIQDRMLESLWYFSIYQLASTCRGDTPPGLFGLWNMKKSPPWHGDFHGDYNMAMAHWFLFSSNHLELAQPFLKTFSRLLPKVKRQTMELYGIDGAKYPIATDPNGVEMTRKWYRMMIVSSAYYAQIFWWHYLYSHDKEFLENITFPILEESSKFYLALTEKDTIGKLVIGPSQAPEQGPLPAYNCNNDLALIKPLWESYVEACRILKRPTPYVGRVAECLAKFPDYPQINGRFLDSATAPENLKMAHTGLFAMVYPGGDVDADHPLAEVAARTVDTHHERSQRLSFVGRETLSDVLGWTTRALASARLRRPEQMDRYLMDGLSEYLKPNGMFSIVSMGIFHSVEKKRAAYNFGSQKRAEHCLIASASSRLSRDRHLPLVEGPSAFVCILNESMLQSHQGVIRIFPSVPERIANCAFRELRAEGAFLVSARCENGKTVAVEITSMAGTLCTLRLFRHNGETPALVKSSNGDINLERTASDTWRFATCPGSTYYFRMDSNVDPIHLRPSGEPASVKFIVDSHGDKIFYGKPEWIQNYDSGEGCGK